MKMRDLVWSICLLFSISIAAQAESVSRGSREHVMAWKNGARSKFTFQVVDMDGMPIEQASIKASFGKEWGGWIDGIADSNGLFTIEHKSAGEMIYNVKKNKYYPTEGKFCFGGEENVVIKDGKWLPSRCMSVVTICMFRKSGSQLHMMLKGGTGSLRMGVAEFLILLFSTSIKGSIRGLFQSGYLFHLEPMPWMAYNVARRTFLVCSIQLMKRLWICMRKQFSGSLSERKQIQSEPGILLQMNTIFFECGQKSMIKGIL